MNVLKRTEFGNPILREPARLLKPEEITKPKIKKLIADMRRTLKQEKLGVGLAAPQVGQGIALAVILIQPTAHRPDVKPFNLVIINPVITGHNTRRKQLWEGCISAGPGKASLFAKVPRYPTIKLKFYDETGKKRHEEFKGLIAHVIQHETDHLNGILFVDRVRDPKTYITYNEYKKLMREEDKHGN